MEDGEKKVSASVLKAIKERRSIRKFKSDSISEMDLHTILEAGIAAPSSKNRQPWHFTVVRGDAKEELARVMERGLNLEVKAHEPFLPESMRFINGAFNSVNVMSPWRQLLKICCWLRRNWASAACGSVISSLPIRKFPNGCTRKIRGTACWWRLLLSVTRTKRRKPGQEKRCTMWRHF